MVVHNRDARIWFRGHPTSAAVKLGASATVAHRICAKLTKKFFRSSFFSSFCFVAFFNISVRAIVSTRLHALKISTIPFSKRDNRACIFHALGVLSLHTWA